MGNQIIKERIYTAISQRKHEEVRAILTKYPQFVNDTITKDSKMTPLLKAIHVQDFPMIQLLSDLGAQPSLPNPRGLTPLMMAAIRDFLPAAKFLIERHQVNERAESEDGLNALDYAILYGYYSMAQYLNNSKMVEIKAAEYYESYARKYQSRFVNYRVMILHLEKGMPEESLPENFLQRTKARIKNPVVDSRETWNEMVSRIVKFEHPPVVDRSELPENMLPENRGLWSRTRTRIQLGRSEQYCETQSVIHPLAKQIRMETPTEAHIQEQ